MKTDKQNNSGYRNSGHYNSGNHNSGNRNSGYYNSGNCNSGDSNSGDSNSGYRNSGDLNSGSYNTGNYNSGDHNSGFFCTETPKATFFDLPTEYTYEQALQLIPYVDLSVCCQWIAETEMTSEEKEKFPKYKTNGGYLKSSPMRIQEAFPIAWAKMSQQEKQKWLDLPNFNAEKFLKITGVDVREDKEKKSHGKLQIELEDGTVIEISGRIVKQ